MSEIPPDFSGAFVYAVPAQANTDNPTPTLIPPRSACFQPVYDEEVSLVPIGCQDFMCNLNHPATYFILPSGLGFTLRAALLPGDECWPAEKKEKLLPGEESWPAVRRGKLTSCQERKLNICQERKVALMSEEETRHYLRTGKLTFCKKTKTDLNWSAVGKRKLNNCLERKGKYYREQNLTC